MGRPRPGCWELESHSSGVRKARPRPETGLCRGSVSTYPRGLLLGVQQRGIEAGRQAGGGEDLPEWDLGFPQEPERREK